MMLWLDAYAAVQHKRTREIRPMNGHRSDQTSRSLYVDVLHYASIVALVGLAAIFLMIFLVGGTAQLMKVPTDYYYGDYPYAVQSLWDYVYGSIDPQYSEVAHQSALIASFTLAFFFSLGCAAASTKIRREGPRLWLLIATVVLAGAGAGALHSSASVVFALPIAAALYGLVATMIQSGAFGASGTPGAYPGQHQWQQGWNRGRPPYPPQEAYGAPGAYPAGWAAPAGAPEPYRPADERGTQGAQPPLSGAERQSGSLRPARVQAADDPSNPNHSIVAIAALRLASHQPICPRKTA
jgi:hypothetical protein